MAKGHDKLTPEGERFFKQLAELASLQARVGYRRGEAATEDGVDLVDVAAYNELGTANIPARPFLRNSVDNNLDAIYDMGVAQLKNVINGGTPEQALNAMGAMQVGLIQDTIANSPGWAEPNAPATIKKKAKGSGSTTPLVDTGGLLGKVHHVIVPKGTEE